MSELPYLPNAHIDFVSGILNWAMLHRDAKYLGSTLLKNTPKVEDMVCCPSPLDEGNEEEDWPCILLVDPV